MTAENLGQWVWAYNLTLPFVVLAISYAAARCVLGNEIKVGIKVGVTVVGFNLVLLICFWIKGQSVSMTQILVIALFIPAAYAGARLARWRHGKIQQQCDQLDPWKSRGDD